MIAFAALPWLSAPVEALMTALFVPRCGACDQPLAQRPAGGLCTLCEGHAVANDASRCVHCDAPGTNPCARCRTSPMAFSHLRAPWVYGGSVAALLKRGKFEGRDDLCVAAAHHLLSDTHAQALAQPADMLVPVPLSPARGRERGYNQSVVIAKVLARAWRKPLIHALRRTRNTTPQSHLPLAERPANVQQAFAPRRALTGYALLIDDVVTSGETVHQAACALKQAGLRQVAVLAVARAPDPTWNQEPHG